MHDLILLEKISPSSDCWPNLIRDKNILELSVEQILNKYQGFEGELVCSFNIEENKHGLDNFLSKCSELQKMSNCLLLHVLSGSSVMPPSLKEEAIFVGYDIGVCEHEATIYSSIFNEVLFGGYDELIAYKDLLNENLLFSEKTLSQSYVNLHNQMSSQGKNVEDYMEMIIYEVWKHKE